MRGLGSGETNGISDKWLRINQVMKESRLTALAIQEAHLTCEKADRLNELFESSLRVLASPDPQVPTMARGVAIVLNKNLLSEDAETNVEVLVPGRAMSVTINWSGRSKLKITNVYAPNDVHENANFWRKLKHMTDENDTCKMDVLLGDFNIVTDALDRLPIRKDRDEPVEALNDLLNSLRLTDGWRNMNPDKRCYSFLQTSTASQSRIDRIYIKTDLEYQAADWTLTGSGVKTDHLMASVSIANYAAPYIGKGRWTITKSILQDHEFIDATVTAGRAAVMKADNLTSRSETENVQLIYQRLKDEIRDMARKRSKVLFAKWDKKIEKLRKEIEITLNDE
ncbi:Endonuclease/exonuclease/phosphatase, partial [Lenzites betulinus]